MLPLRTILTQHWDRLATYTCFTAFGIASLAEPSYSLRTPSFFSVLFHLELVLAGVILMISLFMNTHWMRVCGYVIYLIGMLTIAGLILIRSGSPVWLIVLGFAFQGMISVRYVTRERRVSDELAKMVEDLEGKQRGD